MHEIFSNSKIVLPKPRSFSVLASRVYSFPPPPCYRSFVYTPWLRATQKLSLLTRCFTAFTSSCLSFICLPKIPANFSQLSRSLCRCPLIPRNQIPPGRSTHEEREREGGRGTSNFRNFAVDGAAVIIQQRERNVSSFLFSLFTGRHGGLKHWWKMVSMHSRTTGGDWEKRCRRSISLSPRAHPPSDRGGACAWPGVGVADATARGESLFSRSSISSRSLPFDSPLD